MIRGLGPTVPHCPTAYKIIGTAMEVHRKLGPGHREEVYHQAMLKELPEAG
ncbi:MAG: GxxExxY protein [Chloroflexi bacterium]|nr:GxxExxY protein [Chloroflexota bacterium]